MEYTKIDDLFAEKTITIERKVRINLEQAEKRVTSLQGQLENATNGNFTGNLTVNQILQLNIITLPTCASATNGSIARNSTGVYGCGNTGAWTFLF